MTKSSRIVQGLLIFVVLALLLLVIWSAQQVATPLLEYRQAQGEYQVLREVARPQSLPPPDLPLDEVLEEIEEESESPIDWDALRAINPNIVGWIVILGTHIDHPVVQGPDNARYLSYTFSGERNPSGAIFMDVGSAPDFSSPNTIIHGHNMQNGSMFAELLQYRNLSFLEAHPVIIIYTPDGVLMYEILSARIIPARNAVYSADYEPEWAGGRQIATLSTCVNGSPDQRMVVQGQLM